MDIDAVIVSLELQVEIPYKSYGHWIAFRFIDTYPSFPKLNQTIDDIKKYDNLDLVAHHYTYTEINETTDLTYLDITRH